MLPRIFSSARKDVRVFQFLFSHASSSRALERAFDMSELSLTARASHIEFPLLREGCGWSYCRSAYSSVPGVIAARESDLPAIARGGTIGFGVFFETVLNAPISRIVVSPKRTRIVVLQRGVVFWLFHS